MTLLPHIAKLRRHRVGGGGQYVVIVMYNDFSLDWNVWAEFSSKTIRVCFRSTRAHDSKGRNGLLSYLPPSEKLCNRTEVIQLPEGVILESEEDIEVDAIFWPSTQKSHDTLRKENLDARYLHRLEIRFRLKDEFDYDEDEVEDTDYSSDHSASSDSSGSSLLYDSNEESDEAQLRTSESEIDVCGNDLLQADKEDDIVGEEEEEEEEEKEEEIDKEDNGKDSEVVKGFDDGERKLSPGRRARSPSPELEARRSRRRTPDRELYRYSMQASYSTRYRCSSVSNVPAASGGGPKPPARKRRRRWSESSLMLANFAPSIHKYSGLSIDDTAKPFSPYSGEQQLKCSEQQHPLRSYQDLGLLSTEALGLIDSGMETDDESDSPEANYETAEFTIDPNLLDWSEGIVGD